MVRFTIFNYALSVQSYFKRNVFSQHLLYGIEEDSSEIYPRDCGYDGVNHFKIGAVNYN